MGGFSVLVVEDEPLIALDTEDMLRDFGVSDVEIMDEYAQVEAALTDCAYGLVLFDLDLDGVSTEKLVADYIDKGCRTVVVSGSDEAPAKLIERDVRVLTKPLNAASLKSVLVDAGLTITG